MKKLLLLIFLSALCLGADSKTDTVLVPKTSSGNVIIRSSNVDRITTNSTGTTTVSGPMTLNGTVTFSSTNGMQGSTTSGIPILGRTDGSSASAGMVGEVKTFTAQTVTISTNNAWYVNTTPLTTLTSGTWLILSEVSLSATTATAVVAKLSTSTTAGSGFLPQGGDCVLTPNNVVNYVTISPAVLIVTTSTPIYAQGFEYGSAVQNITISGYAIRIN